MDDRESCTPSSGCLDRALLITQQRPGTPYGAHCEAATTGAKSETTGSPTAAARCAGPVLGTTTTSARSRTAASSAIESWPPRSSAAPPATKPVRQAVHPQIRYDDPMSGRHQRRQLPDCAWRSDAWRALPHRDEIPHTARFRPDSNLAGSVAVRRPAPSGPRRIRQRGRREVASDSGSPLSHVMAQIEE